MSILFVTAADFVRPVFVRHIVQTNQQTQTGSEAQNDKQTQTDFGNAKNKPPVATVPPYIILNYTDIASQNVSESSESEDEEYPPDLL